MCLSVMSTLPVAAVSRPSPRDGKPHAKPDPVFVKVVVDLRSRTRLAVVLPSRLPDLGQGRTKLYASLSEATPRGYEIVLGFTPDCSGGTACRIGTIGARMVAAPQVQLEGKAVTLGNGTAGWFAPATCGASCSDSLVTWRDGETERFVGIKAADEKAVIALADAVASGARVR